MKKNSHFQEPFFFQSSYDSASGAVNQPAQDVKRIYSHPPSSSNIKGKNIPEPGSEEKQLVAVKKKITFNNNVENSKCYKENLPKASKNDKAIFPGGQSNSLNRFMYQH